MPKTVSQAMSDEQRRDELIMGLAATTHDKVFVNVSHLIQAIGMNEAEKLVESLTDFEETNVLAFRPRSTLRAKYYRAGICQIDRELALEACKKAKQDSAKKAIERKLNK